MRFFKVTAAVFGGVLVMQPVLAANPLTCLLAPVEVAELGSREAGVVDEITVDRADFVKQGDPLLVLDQGLLEVDRRRQQVVVDSLSARIARNQTLADSKLIATDELEELKTNLALAKLDLERLEAMKARTVLRAPFSGFITDVYVAPGELVSEQPVMRLIDTRVLLAEMSYLDTDFGTIKVGQTLKFGFDLVKTQVSGTVVAVGPSIEPESNTFQVTAKIDNPKDALPAGISCRVGQ